MAGSHIRSQVKQMDWPLGMKWAAVTVGATFLGALGDGPLMEQLRSEALADLTPLAIPLSLAGFLVGIAQWWVLRGPLGVSRSWIVWTAIGWLPVTGYYLVEYDFSDLWFFELLIIAGAAAIRLAFLVFGQLGLLGDKLTARQQLLWLAATLLATAGAALWFFFGSEAFWGWPAPLWIPNLPDSLLTYSLLDALIYALVTGLALAWIRRPGGAPEEPDGPDEPDQPEAPEMPQTPGNESPV